MPYTIEVKFRGRKDDGSLDYGETLYEQTVEEVNIVSVIKAVNENKDVYEQRKATHD